MPIPSLVMSPSIVTPRPLRLRFDPMLAVAIVLLVGAAAWMGAPLATGASTSATGNLALSLDVPVATSVTPGWTPGDTSVRLPNVALPGDREDATSNGWRLSSNWANGYEVRIRSTTDPALRGQNAVDGAGVSDAFSDFSTADACPCPWSTGNATKGVFGYTAVVSGAVKDASKWGSPSQRKWRGLNKASYQLFSTSGGTNQYAMGLVFRSEIPPNGVQPAGSYRASFVLSVSPLL